jgi:hypothetical protein
MKLECVIGELRVSLPVDDSIFDKMSEIVGPSLHFECDRKTLEHLDRLAMRSSDVLLTPCTGEQGYSFRGHRIDVTDDE